MQKPGGAPNAPRRTAAGTATGGDALPRQPIRLRTIQPASTLDSLGVLNENVSTEVLCAPRVWCQEVGCVIEVAHSEEEQLLRSTAARFVDSEYPRERVREVLATQQGTGTFLTDKKPPVDELERRRRIGQLCGELLSRAGAEGIKLPEIIEQLIELQNECERRI